MDIAACHAILACHAGVYRGFQLFIKRTLVIELWQYGSSCSRDKQLLNSKARRHAVYIWTKSGSRVHLWNWNNTAIIEIHHLTTSDADPGFWNGGGGWIFSTSVREIREIKYYFNIWGIRKKKRKKGAQKKGEGGENSPISPPVDPRLNIKILIVHMSTALVNIHHISRCLLINFFMYIK